VYRLPVPREAKSYRCCAVESVAYYIALLMIVSMPPAILYWFLIHPFAAKWRKVGPLVAYPVVGFIAVLFGAAIYRIREPLLRIHFAFSTPLAVVAIILLGVASCIRIQLRRHFKALALLGLPEVSRGRARGKLVTEGIYSKIRHPRYVEIGISIAALALLANYLALYVLLALYIPSIYLVVLLEERELRNRFGKEYEDYCRKVPRFVPRLARR